MNNGVFKFVLLSFGLFVFSHRVVGQLNEQEAIPRAPNAQSTQQFTEVPVDLSNGLIDISIPLYTVKGGALNVPIILRYHGGGIKTGDDPSWVGLGWDLQCAGQVSRSIRSNPDEGISTRLNGYYRAYLPNRIPIEYITYRVPEELPKGYVLDRFYRDPLEEQMANEQISGGFFMDGDPYSHFQGSPNAATLLSAANGYNANLALSSSQNIGNLVRMGVVDLEPDQFSVNVPGFSGEFMLSGAQNFKMMPYGNASITAFQREALNVYSTNMSSNITYIDSMNVREFYGWRIQSENGVAYTFGANGASFMDKGLLNKARFFGTMTEWPLEQMVDINTRDTVIFTNKKLNYQPSVLSEIIFDYALNSSKAVRSFRSRQTEQQNVHIPEMISTSTEKVQFFSRYVDGTYELDSILICNRDAVLKRKIEFTYDQFKSSGRMKLESVRILGEDRITELGTYLFNYFDTLFTPRVEFYANTPTYYDKNAFDYWGYYNHRLEGDSTSATQYRASWPHTMSESLTGITYPTGTNVSFEYEPNDYFRSRLSSSANLNPQPNRQTGGIRVKTILTKDLQTGKTSKRSFDYKYVSGVDGGESSGYQNVPPTFFHQFQLQHTSDIFYHINYLNKRELRAPVVQYAFVRESMDDGANGFVDHEFYTEANTPDSTFYTNYKEFAPRPYYRNYGNYPERYARISYANLLAGKPKSKKVRSSLGVLLQEENYSYKAREMGGAFQFLKAYLENVTALFPPSGNNNSAKYMSFFSEYHEFQKYVYLKTSTNSSFSTTGDLLTTRSETYGHEGIGHANPTWTKLYTSNGDSVEIRTVYAYDCSPYAMSDPLFGRLKNSGYNPVVGTYKIGRGSRLLSSEVTYFGDFGVQPSFSLFPRLVRSSLINGQLADIGVLNTYPISSLELPSIIYEDKLRYTYNAKGNLLNREFLAKPSENYIWNDRGTAAIAKGVNGQILAYTSFENRSAGGWGITSNNRISEGFTGNTAYNLLSGAINKAGLVSSLNYVLSYWTKNAAPLSLSTAGISVGQLKASSGEWRMFEHNLLGVTALTLSSNSAYILDEVALQVKGGELESSSYDDFFRLISRIDISDKLTSYVYDGGGRLRNIRDHFGNVLEEYRYNINVNQVPTRLYFSAEFTSHPVRRNNCSAGYSGELVTYTVPIGMFTSTRSQADANEKALTHLAEHKQAYANNNGGCSILYFNVEKFQNYTKTNCSGSNYGTTISYVVPAGKYSSSVSQAAADYQAVNEVSQNGQAFANLKNVCQAHYERRKYTFINSSTGVFNFIAYVDGEWKYMDQLNPGQQKTVYLPSHYVPVKGWITGVSQAAGFNVKIGSANAQTYANNSAFNVSIANEITIQVTSVVLY